MFTGAFRYLLFGTLLCCTCLILVGQTQTSLEFQQELNKEYASKEDSPLDPRMRRKFKGLPFFPIDEKYVVKAQFERIPDTITVNMKTTTTRIATYDKYGKITFTIDQDTFGLFVYQSHRLRDRAEYANHLFLPFKDLTNGETSYGGGRFIDLEIPEGNEIIIDFNKAYNPYCAYSTKYSCPITPEENFLNTEIKAGVKYEGH